MFGIKKLRLEQLKGKATEFTVDSNDLFSSWLLLRVRQVASPDQKIEIEVGLKLGSHPVRFAIPLGLDSAGKGEILVKLVGEPSHLKVLSQSFLGQLTGFTLSRKAAALWLFLRQIKEWITKPRLLFQDSQEIFDYFRQNRLTGVKTFLRRRLQAGSVKVQSSYSLWLSQFGSSARALPRISSPPISLIVPVYNTDPRWLKKMIESVKEQTYPFWELCLVDDASTRKEIRPILEQAAQSDSRIKVHFRKTNGHIVKASNDAIAMATGDFVGLLDHDDELESSALYCVAHELNRDPQLNFIYTDEDKIDSGGIRSDPHFKTDWNPDLLYSANVVCHFAVLRKKLVELLGGFREGFEGSQDYDLFLRASEVITESTIKHIPRILYHWRLGAQSTSVGDQTKSYAAGAARRAITEHLQRKGKKASVLPGYRGYHRVVYDLPNPLPKVSVIVPTRDRADLLGKIARDILERTHYDPLELVIVDNQSRETRTQRLFDRLRKNPRVVILPAEGDFNFSAINNLGATRASGEVLAFLNNDLRVISPDWLREMVRFIGQPEIGIVGAKLLYPDDTIQHVGITLGIRGIAGHSLRRVPRAEPGYMSRANLIQGVSAVTAACLLTSKKVFDRVGGFDENQFAVAFNDVDFCLKVRQAGYRIVMTPYAELYHLESASRGADTGGSQKKRFEKESFALRERWGQLLNRDPFYNPNLTVEAEDFGLAFPPRVDADNLETTPK